jgi:hypothetical protein
MVITTSIEIFASNYRQEQAKKFWNLSKKYQKFDTPSPPVSQLSTPIQSFQKENITSLLYKPGDIISYNMGRGVSKRSVVARVITVSSSGKSIKTEDGHIIDNNFVPSGIKNSTTKDCLQILTRDIKKLDLSKHNSISNITTNKFNLKDSKFSKIPRESLEQIKEILIPHLENKGYILNTFESEKKNTYDYLKISNSKTKSSPICIIEYGTSSTAKSWKIGTLRIINISDEKMRKYQKYIKKRNRFIQYINYCGENIRETIEMIEDLLK